MHLCDIHEDAVSGIEIPTGVPLLYDFEHRCVRLLDDQHAPPPRDRYDFGTSGDLLFTPKTPAGEFTAPVCPHAVSPHDPHIYLDDHFYDDTFVDLDAQSDAEREAWDRVRSLDDPEEFTTHVSDFWRVEVRDGATEFDDEPTNAEI